jgi:hypothetical protein
MVRIDRKKSQKMKKRNSIVLGAAVAVIAVASAALLVQTRTGEAAEIEVREEGLVVASAQADDALAAVSARVGFEVKVPARVPDGYALASVDSQLGPSDIPNALKLAILTYIPTDQGNRGTAAIRIEESGFRYAAPADRAEKVDLGVVGAEVWHQATERASGYWVFTPQRGFLVAVTGPGQPSDAEVRKLVASLVE